MTLHNQARTSRARDLMMPPPRRIPFARCFSRGLYSSFSCLFLCALVALVVVPLCLSAAWVVANPVLLNAVVGLKEAYKPEVCDPLCNSFDAVEELGKYFLAKTKHQSVFPATDFPWTESLRRNYHVFRSEFFIFTESSRVPFQKELGPSQEFVAGQLGWRTVPLRLSFTDTNFAEHFPKSMKLIRNSGVQAFSIYLHYMARRYGTNISPPPRTPSTVARDLFAMVC